MTCRGHPPSVSKRAAMVWLGRYGATTDRREPHRPASPPSTSVLALCNECVWPNSLCAGPQHVEANARGGTSQDRFIQRAHHQLVPAFRVLSWVSRSPPWLPATDRTAGSQSYLLCSRSEYLIGWPTVLSRFALVIMSTAVDGLRRLVPKYLAVARRCAPRAQSWPARCCSHCCSPRPSVSRSGRRAGVDGIRPAEGALSSHTAGLVSLVRSSARIALGDATA